MNILVTTPYDEEVDEIDEEKDRILAIGSVHHNKNKDSEVHSICTNMHKVVLPGDDILDIHETRKEFLKGLGIYERYNKYISCVLGKVSCINKLVYVESLNGKYVGSLGDLLVGRIKEIVNDRWVVEIGSYYRASLSISQANVGALSQRIRVHNDVINMSNILEIDDIIACEVQRVSSDGSIMLHTRSTMYGKLENGILVIIPQTLVQYQKKHIFVFPCKVQIILGMNGWVWISSPMKHIKEANPNSVDEEIEDSKFEDVTLEQKKNITIIANIIKLLGKYYININYDIIIKMFTDYVANKHDTSYILQPYVSDSYLFNYLHSYGKWEIKRQEEETK